MTTSSPKEPTNKLYKKGMTYITDEDLRAEYGIVEPLTGKALDDECERIQAERNRAWKESKKK